MKRIAACLLVAGSIASISACRKPSSNAVSTTAAAAQTPAGTTGQPAAQDAAKPGTQPAQPAPKPMPAQLPDVLARVNGQDVKKVEFDRLVKNFELQGGPIPAERRDEVMRAALDQLITYTVLQQEVKARNITPSEAEVEERVKQMQSRFPNADAFTKALADRNMTVERLKDDARVDMAIGKMIDAEVSKQPGVTDAQVREFYDKNPDEFKQGETVRASHILIKVDPNADEATKKKARAQIDDVLKQVKAGQDFGKLAQKHSQDGSAAQEGDLGFFRRGQMVGPFDAAAFTLKPGEISDVVTTQFGYHIIKVAEKRPPSTVPFEQVSDRIRQYLDQQQKQDRARAFVEGVKNKCKIEVLV